MEGIVNLKALVIASLELHQEAAKAYEDKKISIWEGVKLVPSVFSLIKAGRSIKDVLAEVNDGISAEENAELESAIESKFATTNPKAKVFLQHALANIISTAALVNEFKHINDPVV